MEVGVADRWQLEGWLRSHSTSQALVTRARIVLGSAEGESIRELTERLEVTQRTVCLWRRRYREAGLAGLRSLPRSGRPRTISTAKERAVSKRDGAQTRDGDPLEHPSPGQRGRAGSKHERLIGRMGFSFRALGKSKV